MNTNTSLSQFSLASISRSVSQPGGRPQSRVRPSGRHPITVVPPVSLPPALHPTRASGTDAARIQPEVTHGDLVAPPTYGTLEYWRAHPHEWCQERQRRYHRQCERWQRERQAYRERIAEANERLARAFVLQARGRPKKYRWRVRDKRRDKEMEAKRVDLAAATAVANAQSVTGAPPQAGPSRAPASDGAVPSTSTHPVPPRTREPLRRRASLHSPRNSSSTASPSSPPTSPSADTPYSHTAGSSRSIGTKSASASAGSTSTCQGHADRADAVEETKTDRKGKKRVEQQEQERDEHAAAVDESPSEKKRKNKGKQRAQPAIPFSSSRLVLAPSGHMDVETDEASAVEETRLGTKRGREDDGDDQDRQRAVGKKRSV
ncbi:hypothetical protein OBBRIDRAFT_792156 [Obba rivulosa]|uniref:Uncharacterized protein n=1 Tax=Obba rivulosa TaxID=1052685 RepID=A0A8E2B0B3_9APHY|nr:hypothetical protein OBBRIDRAFT_792156 [Obba rivulosa]